MDMMRMSTLSEEQRRNQINADVAQENAERQKRSVELLDPNAQEERTRGSRQKYCHAGGQPRKALSMH